MRKSILILVIAFYTQFSTPSANAVAGTCEATGNYVQEINTDWTKEQNVTGATWPVVATVTGSNYQINCGCDAGTKVNLYYSTISALTTTGHLSGFYHLNNNLDIKTEINDIPGTATVLVPTKIGSPIKDTTGSYSTKTTNSVCVNDPPEQRFPAVSIGANTTFTLYVSTPFLGEMIIPDTTIAYIQAAWSSTSTYPKTFATIAELHIQGRITVPQSCKINQGEVIQVNLGTISATHFMTKDRMPENYTPVSFDITYDCGDMSGIKNSLYMLIEGDDVASQYVMVARRRESDNVPDVGIRLVDITSGYIDIPINPGTILLNRSGVGATHMQAYPVNLTGGTLATGHFKGTATITLMIK